MREFVAIRDAKIVPLSAHTGQGLDSLRITLAAALSQRSTSPKHPPSVETPDALGLEPQQHGPPTSASEAPQVEEGGAEAVVVGPVSEVPAAVGRAEEDGEEGVEVVMAEAPEGAATATVLDYVSSAKTGKVLVSFSSHPALHAHIPRVMLSNFVVAGLSLDAHFALVAACRCSMRSSPELLGCPPPSLVSAVLTT